MTNGKQAQAGCYDDGKWHASTLGHFVGLLVDNDDQAVLFRVVHESADDARGAYICTFEVMTLPQGRVIEAINEKVPIGVHPVLSALIAEGIIS